MPIIITILVLYIALAVGIGIYCNRKANTVNEYVLGGRSVGPWITAFAYGTSYFSAVIFVGYAGKFGWNFGVSSTWIGIGNCLIGSLMAWALMGRRTRVMSKHLESSTMPEFFERRYMSKTLKIVAAIIVFIFLIPYTASVYNGLSRLFEMVFHVDYSICVIAMAVVTAVYVILGGYKATAYNDFIQGIIMLIGIAAVVIATLANKGGFYEALNQMSQIPNEKGVLAGMQGAYSSFFGPDPINLLGVIILTSLGTWGLPQMVTKFYTIKDERSIKSGMIVSTAFALVVAGGCYFLGGFGRIFVAPDANGAPSSGFDGIIPAMLESLPDLLIGVVVVLVLSASMSTLSSLVLTSSSSITLDLIKPMMKGKLDEKKQLLILRAFVAVFLVVSVIIALNKNALISDLMGYSWGALAGAFLAPFLYGLFWKKTTRASVWVSFIFGIGVTVLHLIMASAGMLSGTFLGFTVASPVNLGAFTMVGSLIIVPIVSLVTPKMRKIDLDYIFSCYGKKVVVKQSEAITSGEETVEEAVPARASARTEGTRPANNGSKKKKKKKK
ncbi:MAG: sodium/solute symporter [Ruminiclostridium sp.]|nr:sodium/solute symporter [Ruminiclostridium sp.]